MPKNPLKSEFSKNVLVLMTGSSIAQLIPILLMPILGRLFTPEEFGILAFYTSIITFLSIFATGRYELAILLPKEHKSAVNILGFSFIILFSFTALISLSSFIFSSFIFGYPRMLQLGYWVYLIPVFVFLLGGINILTAWNNRIKKFGRTSFSKVLMYGGEGVSSTLVGFPKNELAISTSGFKSAFAEDHIIKSSASWSFHGLILSKFIGLLASFFYLALFFIKNHLNNLKEINTKEMNSQAHIYIDFPKINMWHAATDELKTSGLTFLILYFFLETTLGIYNMTYRMLRAPLAIIGASFSQVFFQKAAEKYANQEALVSFVQSTTKKLFFIGLPIFIIIYIFSPLMFEVFLGESWAEAGIYARYLAPWLFVNFVISPISQVAIIFKKQFAFWMINLFSNLLIFFAIFISGWLFEDITVGFIFISISQVLFYIWVYFWIIKTIKIAEKAY